MENNQTTARSYSGLETNQIAQWIYIISNNNKHLQTSNQVHTEARLIQHFHKSMQNVEIRVSCVKIL